MKFIKCTKKAVELRCDKKESWRESFVFDIKLIPHKPTPARVVITSQRGAKRWSMSWRKFLKQGTVGDIVIIPKKEFEAE